MVILHGNTLFSPIEKVGFDINIYESPLLLSYRAMCNERRKKEILIDARERFLRIKNIENKIPKTIISQIKEEMFGAKLGIKDNLHYEKYFVSNISNLQPEEFTFMVRKLPITEVCISGVYTFEISEQLMQLNISEENYDYPSEVKSTVFQSMMNPF